MRCWRRTRTIRNKPEWRSNYTISGQKYYVDGVIPANDQEHETLELTEGITSWSEGGFSAFTSGQDGHGVQWVGDHIRPRVRAPDSWHLPVGLSLSTAIGYQRAVYSPDTRTWEIRPIIDKLLGRWHFAFNPALEHTWNGPGTDRTCGRALAFPPAIEVSYDFTRVVSAGVECYADYGRLGAFDALHEQQQRVFRMTNRNTNPRWKSHTGIGVGPTAATDHLIVKGILGHPFHGGRHSEVEWANGSRRVTIIPQHEDRPLPRILHLTSNLT